MAEPEKRKHRSVSQINQYNRCPYSYKLSRIDKAWQRPAAWTRQGSAVHEAAEAYERSGRTLTLEQAQDVFRESYAKHINEALETTPNFEYWFASGPYGGEKDTVRRFGIGLEQVEKYIRWYDSHPEEVIWIAPAHTDPRCARADQSQAIRMNPDDAEKMLVHVQGCDCRPETPGIEIGFDIDLDGVMVRGFIDAVIQGADGDVLVRDNKTGNNPGDDFQLGVYGVALAEQFGIDPPQLGDYWMGRSGRPTFPYKIGEWTRERVSEKFRELEDNIQAERFEPKPDPKTCNFCDVSLACEFRAS